MRGIGLALVAAALLAAPAAQAAETKHSVANGCFQVGDASYRFKATTLAQYLLYSQDGKYLASDGSLADAPSEATEWVASEEGGEVKLSPLGEGDALTVGASAEGCAEYPEIPLNASGDPLTAPNPFGEIRGFMEAHIHMMAFEFLGGSLHCGRPWHEYGAPFALADCPDHVASGGCGAIIEAGLGAGGCHDTGGWPTFTGWPKHDQITHEQTYYRWLERAWLGGLRVYVNLFVENSVLCELYPLKRNSCDEMESVRLQNRDIHELERYIDAQSGGPGEGFFRIVTNPFEARKAIADGKLAVILGIEVSELFNCSHEDYVADCTKEDIDRQLQEVYDFGVRDMELVNKFDNALAGVAGDGGAAGPVINMGNKYETNTFWDIEKCEVGEGDKEQPALPRDVLIGEGLAKLLPPGSAPLYGEPPHCNTRGLTDLGEYLVRKMMKRGMVVDPDHLSQAARDELFAVTESKDYSGLISSHSWSNEQDYPRIYDSGGVVAPNDNNTKGYVEDWQRLRKQADPQYFFGIGYGADMNGFSTSAGPVGDEAKVEYPFKSFDGGVTLDKQKSGEQEFDINTEGIAHYGLFPDWVEALRKLAGTDEIVDDMANGAEAYLQMWERAVGVPAPRCRARTARLRAKGVRNVVLGLRADEFLRRAGQPQERAGRVWTWCIKRRPIEEKNVTAVLTPKGRSALIATNAKAQRAAKIGVGDSLERLERRANRTRAGVFTRKAGGGRTFIYGVKDGKVEYVAVATRAAKKSLKRYLRLAGLR